MSLKVKKIPHWHQILYTSEIVIIPKEYDNWMLVTCSRLEQFPAGSGGNGMSSSLMLASNGDEVCTAVNIQPNTILLNVPWHLYAQLIALIMTDVSHHLSWRGISPYSTVAWVHTAQVFRWRLAYKTVTYRFHQLFSVLFHHFFLFCFHADILSISFTFNNFIIPCFWTDLSLQCFDAVGWAGRASGL